MIATTPIADLEHSKTLFVLPCSKRKDKGGCLSNDNISILDYLPDKLVTELRCRRSENAQEAHVDEAKLLSASKRYTGYLYQAAGTAFDDLAVSKAHMLIISGGYGVVLAHEPIGWYNMKFQRSRWQNGLIKRCLAAYAKTTRVESVVGIFSPSGEYPKEFSNTCWPATIKRAFQVSPIGGSSRTSPHAEGEALAVLSRQCSLPLCWRSSHGLCMETRKLNVKQT